MTDQSQSRARNGPHVFLVVGEASGDRLGAALMAAIRGRNDGRVRFSGVGGDQMTAAGLSSLFPIGELAIIGFVSIPSRLPAILRRIQQTAGAVIAARPDVLVIIDSPDFTHRVARRVRRAVPSLPIVDYVSPTVWAWRPGRARVMRHYVDHVLALLPFEPAVHARLGGPRCSYVGHPLIDDLAAIRPNAEEARRRTEEPPVLLVLPGSRRAEIHRLLGIFGEAIAIVRERSGPLELVLPTLPHLADRITQATSGWAVRPNIVVEQAAKQTAYRRARAALVKSGTTTLELALARVPMVTAYKVRLIEELVARLMFNIGTVILPNLVLQERVVPEFLQRACTPGNLADALLPLLHDSPQRRQQLDAFARLDSIMGVGGVAPSVRAADVVLGLASTQLAPAMAASPHADLAEGRT